MKYLSGSGLGHFYKKIKSMLTTEVAKLQSKITTPVVKITIQPNQWVNKVYTYNDARITADSKQEIIKVEYAESKKAMFDAIDKMGLESGGQGAGYLKLVCKKTVPSVAVEFYVLFRGEK